jgi:hypothetical protein
MNLAAIIFYSYSTGKRSIEFTEDETTSKKRYQNTKKNYIMQFLIAIFTCYSEEGVHLPAGEPEFQIVKRPKQEYVSMLIAHTKYRICHSHFSFSNSISDNHVAANI